MAGGPNTGRRLQLHRLHRRVHGALRRHHRAGAERHQEGAGLLDHLPARLHVRRAGHRRLRGGHLPPADPRLLQGAAVPRLRQRDPRDGARPSRGGTRTRDAGACGHGARRHTITQSGTGHPQSFDPQDMRNMGGLLRKMPRTAWTFIIGGLALSRLPHRHRRLLEQGRDPGRRLGQRPHARLRRAGAGRAADRVLHRPPDRDDLLRQAAHRRGRTRQRARQHLRWMTIPLMVLAVFAVALRLGRHPDDLPGPGQLSPTNPFHHYIGSLAEALHIEAAELPFNAVPLLDFAGRGAGRLAAGLAGLSRRLSASACRPTIPPGRRCRSSIRWRAAGPRLQGAAEQVLLR